MSAITIIKHIIWVFSLSMMRYLIFAGIAYVVCYEIWRARFAPFKIQTKYPDRKHMGREAMLSALSITVFALVGGLIFWLSEHGYTQIYRDFSSHSVAYFISSVLVFILAHDTYFYWSHRFMHWPPIYRYVHKAHHLSTNPTPWAAFSFHPIEAFIEVAIVLIMVFILPLHPFAILAWVLYMTLLNVIGHLGFEIFPTGFTTHRLTRWHNTSTHHNMHHRHIRCNYGLYFNIWDRLMGTNHPEYHKEFENLATKSK